MPDIKLSDKQIEHFHQLLAVDMTDFNCGSLCAPENGGTPWCCDHRNMVPLLYQDELRWHHTHAPNWKMLVGKDIIKMDLPLCLDPEIEAYATCTCAPECPREKRALICRTFPFIPYFNEDGQLDGLTYNFHEEENCPLVGRTNLTYNPKYIQNSCQYWQEILEIFPEDKALYQHESAQLRQRFQQQGNQPPTFRPKAHMEKEQQSKGKRKGTNAFHCGSQPQT